MTQFTMMGSNNGGDCFIASASPKAAALLAAMQVSLDFTSVDKSAEKANVNFSAIENGAGRTV
jgi:hypothetical protein